jgi:hypothetical protein
MPQGLANSSGVLGTHIMDHANTLSAAAIMPGFEGHTTFGNRPPALSSRAIATWTAWTASATRAASFQGGALQSTWTQGKRLAGRRGLQEHAAPPGPWRMVLVAFADCVPRASNRLTLDRSKTDATACRSSRSNSHMARKSMPRWPRPRSKPPKCSRRPAAR